MINYKEVMYGNWVSYKGMFFQLHGISPELPFLNIDEFGAGVVGWNDLEPIPLSEDVLTKFCFEKEILDKYDKESGYYYSLKLSEDKHVDLSLINGDKNGFLEVFLFPYDQLRYQYVHQIQNIITVHSVAGKEINIEL